MEHSIDLVSERLSRRQTHVQKVVQLWISLGCVLGFLTLVNLLSVLHSYTRNRPSASSPRQASFDKEKFAPGSPSRFWTRSVSLLATTFRVVAFRISIPIGFGAHLLLSETAFICVYIASLLICLLVDSISKHLYFANIYSRKYCSWPRQCRILPGSCHPPCCLPTSSPCGPGWEKQHYIL